MHWTAAAPSARVPSSLGSSRSTIRVCFSFTGDDAAAPSLDDRVGSDWPAYGGVAPNTPGYDIIQRTSSDYGADKYQLGLLQG